MERNEIIRAINNLVFNKGTKERSCVEDCEYGLKGISFRKNHTLKGYKFTDIRLYVMNGELVTIAWVVIEDEGELVAYSMDNLSDEELESVYKIVRETDMNTETYNIVC